MLVLDKVTKIYNTDGIRKTILKDVSFSLSIGQSVALIGRNGAGKSSLMKIISGLVNPTSGIVSTSYSISWPVGFAGSFHGDLTGAQNARFVARVYGEPSGKVVDFVEDFAELGEELYKPVRTYSSGMRSRLAFALSMAIEFDLYLIDEVTSVGDANFRKKSADTLLEKIGTCGALVVSHSDDTLKKLCKTSIVIENGNAYFFDTVIGGLGFYNWCRRQYGDNAEQAQHSYETALKNRVRTSPSDVGRHLMQTLIEEKEWDRAESLAYLLVAECLPGAAGTIRMLAEALKHDGQGRWLTLARVATHAQGVGTDEHAFLARNLLTIKPLPAPEIRSEVNAALRRNPRCLSAHYTRARLHFLQDDPESALEAVKKALWTNPEDPESLALRAQIEAALDDTYFAELKR